MPPPKNYIKIPYPRKCEHCDYLSNNPPMYHYHKKTHELIPLGQLCSHGCGSPAMYCGTGGKYICKQKFSLCPVYLLNLSNRTKLSWENAEERKEQTKKSLVERLHNQNTIDKMKKTKRERFGTLDPAKAKEYRHYARYIRARAQKWAKEQGYALGLQTFHVDHKLSILDAWHANLPENIVNHPANLQVMEAKKNSSKGAKSSITVEDLLQLIDLAD